MHTPCPTPVFAPSNRNECIRFFMRNALVLVALILFSFIPAIHCRLLQLLFRLRNCERGNSDGTIDLLADPNEWLVDHPTVARTVVWEMPGGNLHPYSQWTREEKKDLYNAFWKARMNEDTGIPEAPAEAAPETVSRFDGTWFPPESAWRLFVAHIGQSLAAEIAGWVSWSLTSYSAQHLGVLFDSRSFFGWEASTGRYAINRLVSGLVTPGDPVRTFRFLRTNRMIGSTSRLTVENLLEWCRSMYHFLNGLDIANLENHWQYSGYPPVERIISGTARISDPTHSIYHYTAGCHGTTGFLRAVLRTVNLPVGVNERCRHTQPVFLRDNLYLTHGDDPYSIISFFNPPRPAGELLIDEPTYLSWFGPGVPEEQRCNNISRRLVELALDYPTSDYLIRARCNDIARGRPNEDSEVYSVFRSAYPLASLELRNLWGRIDEEIQRRGGCDNIPMG